MKKNILLLSFLICLLLLVQGCSGKKLVESGAADDYKQDEVNAGEMAVNKAPGFRGKTIDGKDISLDQFLGKPVVLNFWASWCPPCIKEAQFLGDTERKYRKDIVFLGVDVRDTKKDARKYLDKYNIDYVTIFDPASQIANAYGVTPIPVTFFIDEKGYIVKRWFGELPEDKMDDILKDLI